jgi:hypothetical protein
METVIGIALIVVAAVMIAGITFVVSQNIRRL